MPCFGALEKSAALGEGEETKSEVLPKSDFTTQVNETECLVPKQDFLLKEKLACGNLE